MWQGRCSFPIVFVAVFQYRCLMQYDNHELKAALNADRTILRSSQEVSAEAAYAKLVAETKSVYGGYDAKQKAVYDQTLPAISKEQVRDISIGYGIAQFNLLDRNGNGKLEKSELDARALDAKAGRNPISGLPAAMELELLKSLTERRSYLRALHKGGSWWNFNMIDPDDVTKDDLSAASTEVKQLRRIYDNQPLLPGVKPDKELVSLPQGVPELFEAAGVEVKLTDEPVSKALAHHIDRSFIIAISQALYNPSSKEIVLERRDRTSKARSHEVGHAIDDALVPGSAFFSDGADFDKAVKQDLAEQKGRNINFERELPTLHTFVQSALLRGSLNESARKELFAEIYQSGDAPLAEGLRRYFPTTGALIDQTLASRGIGRKPQTW